MQIRWSLIEGRNSLCDMLDVLVQNAGDKYGHVGNRENGENSRGITEDGWRRGAKRSRSSGNFFTMSDVEKTMKQALSTETRTVRRASDDT